MGGEGGLGGGRSRPEGWPGSEGPAAPGRAGGGSAQVAPSGGKWRFTV